MKLHLFDQIVIGVSLGAIALAIIAAIAHLWWAFALCIVASNSATVLRVNTRRTPPGNPNYNQHLLSEHGKQS